MQFGGNSNSGLEDQHKVKQIPTPPPVSVLKISGVAVAPFQWFVVLSSDKQRTSLAERNVLAEKGQQRD